MSVAHHPPKGTVECFVSDLPEVFLSGGCGNAG